MNQCFISYFDYMGFKDFILNNENEHISFRMGHIFRDIEHSLGLGKLQEPIGSIVYADISESKINCLNISDTILFWTRDDSQESFDELVQVTNMFNMMEVCFNFPVRGAMVFGEIKHVTDTQQSKVGGIYNISCPFGKGLVNAHIKAENMSMGGFVIDDSVTEKISTFCDSDEYFKKYAIKYMVPYKKPPTPQTEEYVLGLVNVDKKLNSIAYPNRRAQIERAFAQDNKIMTDRAKEILENTLKFLEEFKE